MYGMSSTGTTMETTPLLPCRPAILSPGCMRRLTASETLIVFSTPGASSLPASIFSFCCSNCWFRNWLCDCRRFCSASRLRLSFSWRRLILNQSLRSRPSRYAAVTVKPLFFFGPLSAILPCIRVRARR